LIGSLPTSMDKTAMTIGFGIDVPASKLRLSEPVLGSQVYSATPCVFAWVSQAIAENIRDGGLHHAIWTDLEDLYQHMQRQIFAVERGLAHDLVQTPYVRDDLTSVTGRTLG
jgi:hypothetical protein